MTTTIDEIEDRIYRIHTPLDVVPGGFSFNQYLVVDDEPLLFHTGGKGLFADVRAAIERVMPIANLRFVGFSHVESDECGAMSEMLVAAPRATAVGSRIAGMATLADSVVRPMRPLADGEELSTGTRRFVWIDTPHVPHGWDSGILFERTTRTLFCSDLLTQPGAVSPPVVETDVFERSEAFRRELEYYSHAPWTRATLERVAAHEPRTLACMHGSAWRGEGGAQIRALAARFGAAAAS